MKYTELNIKGYIRLENSDMPDEFTIKVKNKIMIFLGDNGSGKSSIMQLFSYYLCDPKHIRKGGYVRLHGIHERNEYILSCSKESGIQWSILRNGEELNPAFIKKTYLTMIEQLFGIDQQLMNLITGKLRFSTLSTADRRTMLMRMSSTDFDYLDKVYKKCVNFTNYHRNIINHESAKLEKVNATDDNRKNLDILKEDISTIKNNVESLLTKKQNINGFVSNNDMQHMQSNLNSELQKFDKKYKGLERLLSLSKEVPNKDYVSNEIIKINTQIDILDIDITELLKEKELLESIQPDDINTHTKLSNSEIQENIEKSKRDIDIRVDRITHKTLLSMSPMDIKVLKDIVERCANDLIKASMIITTNHSYAVDQSITMDHYSTNVKKLKELTQYLSELQYEHTALDGLIANHIECPKCGTEIDVNEEQTTQYNKVVLAIGITTAEISTVELLINNQQIIVDNIILYNNAIETVNNIINKHDVLAIVGGVIKNNDYHDTSKVIRLLVSDAEDIIYLNTTKEELTKLELLLEQDNDLVKVEQIKIKEKLDIILNKIETHYQTKIGYNSKKIRYQVLVDYYNAIEDSYQKINQGLDVLNENISIYEACRTNNVFTDEISRLNISVNDKEYEYNKLQMALSEYDSVSKIITENKEYQEAYKLLANNIGYKTGLIAKSLTNHVNKIFDMVNVHISNVWEYELNVNRVEIGDKMDYRFSVDVGENTPEDISSCNTSSIDIIDFAMMLTIRDTMLSVNEPVYLDEFGASFDQVHRHNAYSYVLDKLSEHSDSNIFIVSHYIENFSMFSEDNTDMVVLSHNNMEIANVTKPNDVIQH